MRQGNQRAAQGYTTTGESLAKFGTIAGIADGLQILGYFFGVDPSYFSALAIAIKLILLFFLNVREVPYHFNRGGFLLIVILCLLSVISIVAAPYDMADALLKTVPVSISLGLTLAVTSTPGSLVAYGRAVVNFVSLTSVLYVGYAAAGAIETHFGRYLYFSGTHPNAGSEIGAAAIILACMFFRGGPLFIRLAVLFPPLFLMQGRAAIVAGVVAFGTLSLFRFGAHFRRSPTLTLAITALAIACTIIFLLDDFVAVARGILLLDDPNRGMGSNLVGRTDRWSQAIDFITERPWLGYGAGVYDQPRVNTPHNYFLYGFVNLGAPFLIVLAMMAYFYVRALRRAFQSTVIFSSFVVLMLMNDRFLNFALYPFEFYVMLLSLAALPPLAKPAQALVAPARDGDRAGASARSAQLSR